MKNNLIKGIPASPGIAIGKAFLYKENNLEILEKSILSKEEELERLIKGREVAKKQLEEIKENTLKKLGKDKADIFEGHITLLEDEELFLEIDSKISEKKKGSIIPKKDWEKTTGYIHGANNPVGIRQKHNYPIFIDKIALDLDQMIVSAGEVGHSIIIAPQDLASFVKANFADILEDSK